MKYETLSKSRLRDIKTGSNIFVGAPYIIFPCNLFLKCCKQMNIISVDEEEVLLENCI